MANKHITVLVDNDSWILPYAEKLVQKLTELKYETRLARSADAIEYGWINFILGCTRIISEHALRLNQHNLVVHESGLPKGRGFAPMAWQILEGKDNIPVCLIEAAVEADAGDIWLQDSIQLDGSELCDEWRALQGQKTIEMCLRFVNEYPNISKCKQAGVSSYYERRRPTDSCLDVNKTLGEQFNILRVSDNTRYPAYFEINKQSYIVKIYKTNNNDSE